MSQHAAVDPKKIATPADPLYTLEQECDVGPPGAGSSKSCTGFPSVDGRCGDAPGWRGPPHWIPGNKGGWKPFITLKGDIPVVELTKDL